jgi:hypothetical protein
MCSFKGQLDISIYATGIDLRCFFFIIVFQQLVGFFL